MRPQDNDTRVTVTGAVTLPPGAALACRTRVQIEEFRAAQGIVGQYAAVAPWEGGYRALPRFVTDVSDAPLVLPVTGGGLP